MACCSRCSTPPANGPNTATHRWMPRWKRRATRSIPPSVMALYRQVLETLHTDMPAVPLYQDVMMFAARKEVKFQPTPNEAFFLMDMGWSP